VKAREREKLERRRMSLERRLERWNWPDSGRPVFRTSSVTYEVSERIDAVNGGGIGAAHMVAKKVGLVKAIDETLHLLKIHAPYHESDHVLNIAYNIMAGHEKLEDLEILRQSEAYMDALGTERVPDPTTAGDFLRRFSAESVIALMGAINEIRPRLWMRMPKGSRKRAIIDSDGTMTPTEGEKKRGMGISYKGIWCYHPLIISLANTDEPLYIVNRPGNATSSDDAAVWMDRAIALALRSFDEVLLRGDTDFSLTANFDRWTHRKVRFVFGYDNCENLVRIADSLENTRWRRLTRRPRYQVKTRARDRRENTKEEIVRENEYENIRLCSEDIAEFEYQPTKCTKAYRMIVIRKNLSTEKGQQHLFNSTRYFFYITNDPDMTDEEVVWHANARCDQENLIEQLKNGVNALRVPVHDLVSNWAYMVVASLAWTLKAWMGLVQPRQSDRDSLLRMEFKRFLHSVMLIPCQVVRGARSIVMRLLSYTDGARLLFATVDAARRLGAAAVT
jgi:hypothetical protein